MLSAFPPTSTAALAVLGFCFVLVLAFEFSNGFHDTANAVATVIYTHSLKPVWAVLLSGGLNFLGVLLGGVAVAYTLVELLPPDVLTPPNGNPAIGMLLALFLSALIWNVSTWWLGIPCSSSHATIGSIVGVGIASVLLNGRHLGTGVPWAQVWKVLTALLVSPVLGFIGAFLLYRIVKLVIRDKHLYEATSEENPPVWWVRGILITTCSLVSFSHGSNDGQKSIGLIMLVIIGILPGTFALNMAGHVQPAALAQIAGQVIPLVQKYGDDEKQNAVEAANALTAETQGRQTMSDIERPMRSKVRGDAYRVASELRRVSSAANATADERKTALDADKTLRGAVEFAPDWVRVISALCLGIGTMVGYKRIVTTIGERIGKTHLTPAQGGSAELVAAALIGTAGFSGLPVSTTHIVSSGVAGTMAGAGSGVQGGTMRQILLAWVLTLPATICLAGGLFALFTRVG
jgi:PiT family inorganic phosphate transporter